MILKNDPNTDSCFIINMKILITNIQKLYAEPWNNEVLPTC